MRLPTRLLRRKPDSHKGDYGHVFVVAGSARFSGAAVLCAEAALASGAGLVTLGIPRSLNSAIIRIKPKEVMTLPLAETKDAALSRTAYAAIAAFAQKADVVALGPGLSQEKQTQQLVRRIIAGVHRDMVIDADGLNALAGHLDLLAKARKGLRALVLTPHPGEMARLTGSTAACVQKDRKKVAKNFACRYNVVLVLKGHTTVVADSKSLYSNMTGNPGMAKAGSGDVLTGMIASFMGQGLSAFEAAKYGAYLHGCAGDLAAKKKTQLGMRASDIIGMLPEAIRRSS